jgi:DNA repair photolyase
VKVVDHPEEPLDSWLESTEEVPAEQVDRDRCVVRRTRTRAALTPSGLDGFDWALNPYHGCAHRCSYCYAPSVLGEDREAWGRCVEARQNMPTVLSRELRRKERGVVGISSVTDPYQPVERRYQLTRFCLERLLRHDWPVCILTKGDLVVRDLDLLEGFTEAEVGFTITTLDEHQRRLMEPGAPPVARRLAAMRLVSDAGIPTYAFIGPIYPTTSPNELRELVRKVHAGGARYVLVDRLNLKRGVWLSLLKALGPDEHLTDLARRRLFPSDGRDSFYLQAFKVIEDEASALDLPVSRA